MVELEPTKLHWIVDEDPHLDLCAHGGILLKINDSIVSDGLDREWTVSAASYQLLATVWADHDYKNDPANHLIPCCGHTMFVAPEEEDGLCILGCPNGINWEVRHVDGKVIHHFEDGRSMQVTEDEWRDAVCSFSQQVLNFFMTSWPKKCEDPADEDVFELFMAAWRARLDRAACKTS